ncbi:hypothetical protein OQ279_05955 [Salinimicrobium sp. MT39]|uniref:Uncharacterized protein n=1 Tax=Salinimicrobium profundisediminis TaxID=2994553 RepID=A0A9X3CVK9_9FLAO|nr:hypothetical protein [Salinimicrobium profundisediminis]MCX2837692.1 hypothetical protein [Salinimicrobium profundisediminis]
MYFAVLHPDKFRSDIRRFRIGLIVLTALYLGFIGIILIGGFIFILKNQITDSGLITLWFTAIFFGGIILSIYQLIYSYRFRSFERKYIPVSKKKNNDNFKMSIFTGIIGLWLWLPNKKEIKKIIEKTGYSK